MVVNGTEMRLFQGNNEKQIVNALYAGDSNVTSAWRTASTSK